MTVVDKELTVTDVVGTNAHADQPEKGLVLAVLSNEDLTLLSEAASRDNAIDRGKDVSFRQAYEHEREHIQLWKDIMAKYNLNPSWNMSFCHYTGYVISNGTK